MNLKLGGATFPLLQLVAELQRNQRVRLDVSIWRRLWLPSQPIYDLIPPSQTNDGSNQIDHETGNSMPFSFRTGFFNVPQIIRNKCCETGPTVYRPFPRRLVKRDKTRNLRRVGENHIYWTPQNFWKLSGTLGTCNTCKILTLQFSAL